MGKINRQTAKWIRYMWIIEFAYLLLKVVVQTALQRYSLAVKAVRSIRSTVTDITVRAVGGYSDTVLGITG